MKIQIGSLHLMEADDGIGGRTTIPKLLCQKYYRPSNSLLIILFWAIFIIILNLSFFAFKSFIRILLNLESVRLSKHPQQQELQSGSKEELLRTMNVAKENVALNFEKLLTQ